MRLELSAVARSALGCSGPTICGRNSNHGVELLKEGKGEAELRSSFVGCFPSLHESDNYAPELCRMFVVKSTS